MSTVRTPDQKRIRRRWMLFWLTLPLVIAALVGSFKLMSLAPIAQQAIDAFDRGSFETSATMSETLLTWNAVEPWIPYFNRGGAYLGAEHYTEAADDFEVALKLAPVEKQCDVRVNLALSWERLGDVYVRAGFYQGAVLLYEASEAVMSAAGEECEPPPNETPDESDSSEQIKETEKRVAQKKQDAQEMQDAQPDDGEGDGQSEAERKLQELEESQGQAAQEKADDDAENRSGQGGGGYSDRPW